ncbi:MAG: PKD domain-containing protein [Candidatus Dormiibacterota bacterium]
MPVKRQLRPRMSHGAGAGRRRLLIAGAPVGFLLVGLFGYGSPIAKAGAATPAWTAYVVDHGSDAVVPIDTATGATGTPIAVGSGPGSIAITPNGTTAYVVNGDSDNVTPITTLDNRPGVPIPVGSFPEDIAIAPNGKTAYVTNTFSNTVTPINIPANTTQPSIPVGSEPTGIAITPNGQTAYVAVQGSNDVVPIDLATRVPGTPIAVGNVPGRMALSPNGATLYVVNVRSNDVTPIDTSTNVAGTPIAVGSNAAGIAITPNGDTAYVTAVGSGNVTPIDLATNAPGTPIAIAGNANGITITPDGKTAYVASYESVVTPIDLATNTPGTPITAGSQTAGIVVAPDQAPVASFTASGSALGVATYFDASASTVAYGSIASYAWTFGDGSTATTTSPTTTHMYTAAGTYTATVTETSSGGTSTTTTFTGQTVSHNGGPSAHASRVVTIVAPGAYTALSPFRVCDTRAIPTTNQCAGHTLSTNSSIDVQITGKVGPSGQSVPAGALAVALNVTAVSESTVRSFISVFPAGEAVPNVSNISFDPGVAQANLVVVRLAAGGDVAVYNAAGKAGVVVDVEGYFAPPGGTPVAGEYHSILPLRICDTRAGKGTECAGSFENPLPGNTWRDVVLSGRPSGATVNTPSIPNQGAAAAVFNLTAVGPTQSTYLAVQAPNQLTDACPTKAPAVSNVNPSAHSALPNRVISALGPHQDVCIYNAIGSTDFIIDVNGWFGDGTELATTPVGALFYAIPPARICDTRVSTRTACSGEGLGEEQTLEVDVDGESVLPIAGGSNPPLAVVANVTAVAGTATTFLTLFPSDASLPVASDLNPRPGDVVANLAFVGIATRSPAGDVSLYNQAGGINAILDVAGWFQ